ncbi:MAG: LysM peptidoglycan-binding domain-containing protein [Clostridia bacterium]|nr:LysM peptidoglycan-binding domain-containing protein [Clostridia bacterium]
MRELYNEFFHIPKHGKIREKVMLIRTAITVIVMIVCLAAMSFTAFAYFTHNVTSGSNTIKAANFEAHITISNGTNDIPLTIDGKYQTATLPAGTYTVKLSDGDSTADTGFCIITIGENKYHTAQIGEDAARNLTDASVIFTLKISAETKITILSHWGTSSFYGYEDTTSPFYIKATGTEIDLITAANGVDDSTTNEEQDTTDKTTSTDGVYTVQSGDTLSKIAQKHNTTVERIAAYNKLTDINNIQAGQQLKIPPADWTIPADTTEQTTAPTETTSTPETTTSTDTTTPPETTNSVTTESEKKEPETTDSVTTAPEKKDPETTNKETEETTGAEETTGTEETTGAEEPTETSTPENKKEPTDTTDRE